MQPEDMGEMLKLVQLLASQVESLKAEAEKKKQKEGG
jgi:hypothetical protein